MISTISFANGMQMELSLSDAGFLGIGAVRFGKTLLRSPQLPWTVYTESDSGVRFDAFRLLDVEEVDGAVTIIFAGEGRWLPRIQDADAMGDARVKTRRIKNPTATFRWRFRPITEVIEEHAWNGLAMQLQVSSPGAPLHWLLEDTTWEIGGEAAGCTLVQQDVSAIDLEQTVAADSAFSTIERFFTAAADAWGGSFPMDMLPRAAGAAICDFQVKGDLALCLFAEHPGLTRARLDKYADENVIHYADRPFVPLGEEITLPERKLLVYRHPQALARHEWRNLWLDCFTEVRRRIHAQYGFTLEVPLPAIHAHLWDADLHAYGPAWVEPLMAAFPAFAALGYHEVFTHGVWESVTSDPERRPGEGNICCPYSLRYAEMFGGAANMTRLFAAAHAAGVEVYQWFGMQFAKYSPVWKEHPEWVLREANGDPWDGNYGIIQCGRMRSGYGQFLEDGIKKVKDDTGLDHIFWDSYQNLGVTCVDWQGADKAPQAEEIFLMQARLQQYGFKQRCEVVTIFGVSQVGLFGFESDKFRRRLWADTVNGDTAFALLDTSPAYFSSSYPFAADLINPEKYFWLAGHRVVPMIGARPWPQPIEDEHAGPSLPGGELAEEYARVNHLYLAALPHMHRLRVTPDGTYTLWFDDANQPAVVWVFADTEIAVTGPLTDVGSGGRYAADGTFAAKAGRVYLLGER